MQVLANQTAVITGASSGIGHATALRFARAGAAIVAVHHYKPEDAAKLIEQIESEGGRAVALAADVRDEGEVDQVFAQAQSAFGAPTLLVNSAGVDASGIELADMPLEKFVAVMNTNLVGPFLMCRAFVRGCRADEARGKIINVTSVHEDIPRAGASDYCASKGGLRNLTRCLALELAEHGITVNNLAPGMVLTPMNQKAIDDPEEREKQTASIPMKRAATPEEVAEFALFMASSACDYATGTTFTLDGGLQMNLGQGA